jgi:nucleoside-diphosphate-sugar epimerase
MQVNRESISNVEELESLLSEPNERTVAAMAQLDGDIVVLGVGGKMGPTLARMAKRASELAGKQRRVIGVSRFSTPELRRQLEQHYVETHSCDLLDRSAHAQLPDAANVVFMAGMKFGSTAQEARTWAMNSYLPGMIAERYRESRIAAFSTGNVYGLSPAWLGGSVESDAPNPVGEYAMSCVARERMFEHFSRVHGTPTVLLRLNYATELRYGVLLDVARRVMDEQAVPLETGNFNSVWQTDASGMSLQALLHASAPARVLNIAGPELLSVRRVASEFARRFGKEVRFEGQESGDGILSNAQAAFDLFGYPTYGVTQMITWVADWIGRGGGELGKPTHFEVRDGKF